MIFKSDKPGYVIRIPTRLGTAGIHDTSAAFHDGMRNEGLQDSIKNCHYHRLYILLMSFSCSKNMFSVIEVKSGIGHFVKIFPGKYTTWRVQKLLELVCVGEVLEMATGRW